MKRSDSRIKKTIGEFLLTLIGKREPLIVIMVDGGFSSAVAKYILGRYLEIKCGRRVIYDLSWFERCSMDCDGKPTRRLKFKEVYPNLKLEGASNIQQKFYKYFFRQKSKTPYLFSDTLGQATHAYLDGYYVHWKYFNHIQDQLLKELDVKQIELDDKNQTVLADIKASEASVAVHIRRGDFVKIGWCILTPDYYVSAIQHMAKKLHPQQMHVYVFSDDIDWCKEQVLSRLSPSIAHTAVDINDEEHGYFDLRLIAECDHQIISNSGFGFLAALLNTNLDKTVIIPDKWMPEPEEPNSSKYFEGSDQAYHVDGWTVFSTLTHVPLIDNEVSL